MSRYDAVIVGGGPAGLSAAEVIAKNGYKVIVLEARGPSYEKPCGGAISQKTFREFSIPEKIADFSADHVWIFKNGERKKKISWSLFTVRRRKLNQFLAQRARKYGAKIEYYTRVIDFVREKGKIIGAVTKKGQKVFGKFFILSCGIDSSLEKAGFRISKTVVASQCWVKVDNGPKEVQIHTGNEVIENGYGWVIPRGNKLATVGIFSLTAKNVPDHLDQFIEYLRKNKIMESVRILKKNSAVSPAEKGSTFFKNNVFICGSAAGLVTPIYYTGISNALRSGRMCGSVVADLLRGRGAPERYSEFVENIPSISFATAFFHARKNKFAKCILLLKYLPLLGKIYPRYLLCKYITENWTV